MAQERSGLLPRLEKARLSVAAIVDAGSRADTAAARCRQCMENPNGLSGSVTAKQMTEIDDWLSSLKECEKQGHWTALAKGLDRWEQLAKEYLECSRLRSKQTRARSNSWRN